MEVTIINEGNKSYFEPLMPAKDWNEADFVLGAIEDETACGVLAVRIAPDKFMEITYLYVAEDYRRRGIATGLLEDLHEMGQKAGMEGELCQYVYNENMEGLDACLLDNLYDSDDQENPVYAVAFGDLPARIFDPEEVGKKAAAVSQGSRIVPLSEAASRVWNQFLEELTNLPNEDGAVPDLGAQNLYDQDASFLLMRGGEPAGCILIESRGGEYILSYFCILKSAAPSELAGLFQASYQVLKKKCRPEDRIYINALTDTTKKMVLNMTEQKATSVGMATCRYYKY